MSKLKVLYIEPNSEIREVVCGSLESLFDMEVDEASSGNEAFQVIQYEEYDLVITEYKMINGDARFIFNEMKKMGLNIPFLIFTSFFKNDLKDFLPELRAEKEVFHLKKNPNIPLLKNRIDEILNNVEQLRSKVFTPADEDNVNDGAEEEKLGILDDPVAMAKEKSAWASAAKRSLGDLQERNNANAQGEDEEGEKLDLFIDADKKNKQEGYGFESSNSEKSSKNSVEGKSLEESEKASAIKVASGHRRTFNLPKKENETKLFEIEGYKAIRPKRLKTLMNLPCDIYLCLSSTKAVKILSANDAPDIERIEKFEGRNAKSFLVKDKDFAKYQEAFAQLLLASLESAEKSFETTASDGLLLLNHVSNQMKEFGFDEASIKTASKALDSCTELIKDSGRDLKALWDKIANGQDYLSEHSLLVPFFAVQVCKKLEWHSDDIVNKLTLAGMLHDSTLPSSEHAKVHSLEQLESIPKSDREIIRNHPSEGAEVASMLNTLSKDVDSIIAQHHERPDGSGFPRGLTGLQIAPLSCVFILIEAMITKVCESGFSKDVFEQIRNDFPGIYSSGNFKRPLEALLASLDHFSKD